MCCGRTAGDGLRAPNDGRQPRVWRSAGDARRLACGKTRLAGCKRRGAKDAMRDAEAASRGAMSAKRDPFDKGREIAPAGRFSTLSTSPYGRLHLRWESAGLYEVGKK